MRAAAVGKHRHEGRSAAVLGQRRHQREGRTTASRLPAARRSRAHSRALSPSSALTQAPTSATGVSKSRCTRHAVARCRPEHSLSFVQVVVEAALLAAARRGGRGRQQTHRRCVVVLVDRAVHRPGCKSSGRRPKAVVAPIDYRTRRLRVRRCVEKLKAHRLLLSWTSSGDIAVPALTRIDTQQTPDATIEEEARL